MELSMTFIRMQKIRQSSNKCIRNVIGYIEMGRAICSDPHIKFININEWILY